MKDIDVFIDLEGLGVGWHGEGSRVAWLLDLLPEELGKYDFKIRELWGTACLQRKSGRLPGTLQNALRRIFIRNHGTVVWTDQIADTALVSEVQSRLTKRSLAEAVLLITCDHDFLPLVMRLLDTQRHVIVSGVRVSKRLIRVAHRTILLRELPGFENTFSFEPVAVQLNPIEITLPQI